MGPRTTIQRNTSDVDPLTQTTTTGWHQKERKHEWVWVFSLHNATHLYIPPTTWGLVWIRRPSYKTLNDEVFSGYLALMRVWSSTGAEADTAVLNAPAPWGAVTNPTTGVTVVATTLWQWAATMYSSGARQKVSNLLRDHPVLLIPHNPGLQAVLLSLPPDMMIIASLPPQKKTFGMWQHVPLVERRRVP